MKILTILVSVLVALSSQAQTSKEILDKLSAKAKTWKTISAEFTSTLNDTKANLKQNQTGTIKIKGNKYYLTLSDFVVITDGITVWNYNKSDNSCTIDDLADVKDGSFEPSEMFTLWEKDFKHEMKNTAAVLDGVNCYQINLYPTNPKDKSFHTISMYVDKAKMEVIRVVVKTRENAEITYKVKTFKTNTEFPDTEFQFNKSKYPGVEIVDNRI